MTSTPAADDDHGRFTEIELAVHDCSFPLVGLSDELGCYVEVLNSIPPVDDDRLTSFLRVCDPRPERTLRAGRECDRIEEVTLLGEFDEELLVEMTAIDGALRIVELTPTILSVAEARSGRGRITVALPPSHDVSVVVDPLVDAHEGIEVSAIRSREVATPLLTRRSVRTLLEDHLTDRQWEALRRAYLDEYFRRPRETTQRELADAMGISQETFSQHLRTAEDKLLSLLFEEELVGA